MYIDKINLYNGSNNDLPHYPFIQVACKIAYTTCCFILVALRTRYRTKSFLLNWAFNTMKQENHPWLQNVQYLLWQTGLGNILLWDNQKSGIRNV